MPGTTRLLAEHRENIRRIRAKRRREGSRAAGRKEQTQRIGSARWGINVGRGLTIAVRHLPNHVQEQFPIVALHLCEKPNQLPKVASVFTTTAPHLRPITMRSQFGTRLRRFITI